MSQELHLNVLDPQFARYIELRDELEEYLVEIYGPGIDFQVSVSDRCQRGFELTGQARMRSMDLLRPVRIGPGQCFGQDMLLLNSVAERAPVRAAAVPSLATLNHVCRILTQEVVARRQGAS
jgi:hypothetical protein